MGLDYRKVCNEQHSLNFQNQARFSEEERLSYRGQRGLRREAAHPEHTTRTTCPPRFPCTERAPEVLWKFPRC